MGIFDLSFGKKRRRSTKRSKVSSARKPPHRLLMICKKYRVKATRKVGSKRVYKPVSVLKKLCLKKAYVMRKKLMKKCKKKCTKSRRAPVRRRRARRSGFGNMELPMLFGRRRLTGFGAQGPAYKPSPKMMAETKSVQERLAKRPEIAAENLGALLGFAQDCQTKGFAPQLQCVSSEMKFGKRGRVGARGKTSRKVAMKAFSSFYKRHCAGRGSGFGSGGNPPLYASMGYEFCPSGMGGVLGANSTGLFPSPCISKGASSSFGRLPRRRPRRNAMEFGKMHMPMQFGARRRRKPCAY